MTTKTTLKEIQERLKGTKKPVESVVATKNPETSTKQEESKNQINQKKEDGRKHNRGVPGKAGRKPLPEDEKRVTIKKKWETFADEEIEVTELHKGTKEVRKIKMARLRVAQERLFKKVQEGDVSAIKEFNDRVGGKARQPLTGDDDEPPIQVDIGVDRMLDKVYGADEEDD